MLTKDLLRFQLRDGRVVPLLLKPTPANLDLGERLLAHWRQGVGKRRGDIEDAAIVVMHQSRALVAARGMQKLIVDECGFADPASHQALRTEALHLSAALLAKPPATSDEHRTAVAEQLGLDADTLAERLYGDLPDAAVLESAPAWTVSELLARYNLALCQSLLLHAKELTVTVLDADTGLRRKLLKALRFRRLLAEVRGDAGAALCLAISGPGSLLDQASRYGLQLALFLPALACAREWRAEAMILAPARLGVPRTNAILELSNELGLVGDSAFLGHVPEELRHLEATLAEKCPEWKLAEPQLLPLPGGELVAPDLQIESAGATYPVELFHRWHASALQRRLDQLARGLAPRLVIGVDRALAKTTAIAPLLEQPAFVRHGFVFSDLPVPRALKAAVERLAAARG